MENIDFATLFQGIGTMMESGWLLASARVFLVLLGLLLIYLGWKGVLEPMVMIPMGLGMVAINCGTLMMPDGTLGNLFLDPMLSDTDDLMNTMQIDFLQPVYTLTFSNGLIACFVFMGIGTLLDVGFLLQKPFASIFLALCAELGTFLTVPIASALGLTLKESASVAMVGGADGPMVLFTSLALAKHLFVPITVVAYLYLGLTYGGYPYLVKLLVPKRFRAIKMVSKKAPKNYDAKVKLAFSAVLCAVLCFLFPVASPLFFSLFLGVAVRESGMKHIYDFVSGPLLYGSTFMLGVLLGVLCDAHLLLDPKNTEIAGIRYRCLIAFRYRRNYRRIHYVHCQAGKLQSGDWYRCCQLRTYHRKSCPEDSKQGQSGFVRSGRCLGSQYLRSNHLSYYYGYLYYDYPLFIA